MRFKKLLSILLASTLTLGLAGCGSKDSEGSGEAATGNNDKITVWAWDEAFNIAAANQAKEIYLKDNPNTEIEVVTMSQDDIVAKLNTSLSSGSYEGLPNVVLIEDYRIQGYLQPYKDEFADLSSIAKAEDFATYKTGVNNIDGKMYGVPFDSGSAAIFYRVDLIEQAGYTKEDMQNLTWDKYIEIGKAVKEKTGVQMATFDPSDLGEIRMMLQSAGAWYTGENGEVTIAGNQALKDAIQTYKNIIDANITKQHAEWDQFVGSFNKGEVASVTTGCWISPSVQKAQDQSGKWAVAQYPRMANNPNSVNASSLGGAAWYVLKNVGNSELATDFVGKTFASNVDLMNQLAKDINLVSTLEAAKDGSSYAEGNEFYGGQTVLSDFATWAGEVPSVNYGQYTYIIEDMMAEAMQAILQGADIDETLNTYQIQIEAAVAQ